MTLYVTLPLDPASLKAAEDREYREALAGSSIVSIHRESAEEVRRRQFWEEIDARRSKGRKERSLRVVGGR